MIAYNFITYPLTYNVRGYLYIRGKEKKRIALREVVFSNSMVEAPYRSPL